VKSTRWIGLIVAATALACSKSRKAEEPPPRLAIPSPSAPPFADRAPAGTWLLARFDLAGLPGLTAVPAELPAPLRRRVGDCGVDLANDVKTIEVAAARPSRVLVEVRGSLTTAKIACILDVKPDAGGRVTYAGATIADISDGVSATLFAPSPAATAHASDELVTRFKAAAPASRMVLEATLGPLGISASSDDHAAHAALRFPNAGDAKHAAAWLRDAIEHGKADGLATLATMRVSERGDTLEVDVDPVPDALPKELRAGILEAFKVPSASMTPTVLLGDHVFALKGPATSAIRRGDVVAFRYPANPAQTLLKRVVAIGGDRIQVARGRITLNGAPVREQLEKAAYEYVAGDGAEKRTVERWREEIDGRPYSVVHDKESAPVDDFDSTLAQGQIFVLGDNRDNSHDSRSFGPVAASSVVGRVVVVWWSSGEDGVRWNRIGRVVDAPAP
jgi:signal peptidase I